MDKTDSELGLEVHKHLSRIGIETPMAELSPVRESWHDDASISSIEYHVGEILRHLGIDTDDDSITGTARRVAEMYVNETFAGLNYGRFPKCTKIVNKMHSKDEFILEPRIQVNSVCEHHLVTIDGKASVAYIPKGHVLGLSKMNRIVDFFSRRPQVQERLTCQIAETISFVLDTPDVAVLIDAVHYCVKARGIRDNDSTAVTFHGCGRFADIADPIRREFMARSGR